tara:strand:- start:959 stop:1156 length:198 start_codon:yes stop_codon:yes gene_type:complete
MSEQMRIRPPDGQAAIGIDLGTSSSLVAVWTSVTGTIPEVRKKKRRKKRKISIFREIFERERERE